MKNLYIVANWKSHKTIPQTTEWFSEISNFQFPLAKPAFRFDSAISNQQIIVCPSFTILESASRFVKEKQLSIALGAQDISSFDEGAFTGEVNGKQIVELAQYVIIGHSERREKFGETQELLDQKVAMANTYGLKIIFCAQDENTPIPEDVSMVAYEPVGAIGTGKPDTPENANAVAQSIKQKFSTVQYVLYGGSVNGENVASFTSQPDIDGVLVGNASLNASDFIEVINNAQ